MLEIPTGILPCAFRESMNCLKRSLSLESSSYFERCAKKQRTSSMAGRFHALSGVPHSCDTRPVKTPHSHIHSSSMIPADAPDFVNGLPWSSFSSEMIRLCTFGRYPVSGKVSSILLAKNGFVYIGSGFDNDDSVRCFFCGLEHKGWRNNDEISIVHQQRSPSCCMVKDVSNSVGNKNVVYGSQQWGASSDPKHDFDSRDSDSSMEVADSISSDIEADGAFSNSELQDVGESIYSPSNSFQYERNSFQYEMATPESDPAASPAPISAIPLPLASQSVPFSDLANFPEQPATVAVTEAQVTSNESHQENFSQPQDSISVISDTPSTTETSSPIENSSESTTTPPPSDSNNEQSQTSSSSQSTSSQPTWIDLGIFTEQPKRQEFAQKHSRMQTFIGWQSDHHIHPEDLVEAGFYYAGFGDCARCFFCGGGLRNWEPGDDVFVEHVRWFPKCAYIRKTLKPEFINAVKEIHASGQDNITLQNVLDKIGMEGKEFLRESEASLLASDPAVRALIDLGYEKADVLHAAKVLKEENELDNSICAESLLRKLFSHNKYPTRHTCHNSGVATAAGGRSQKSIRDLQRATSELRKETTCKVCLSSPSSVLFLPCGHLACCSGCASSLKDCPICRKTVRGTVLVSIPST